MIQVFANLKPFFRVRQVFATEVHNQEKNPNQLEEENLILLEIEE